MEIETKYGNMSCHCFVDYRKAIGRAGFEFTEKVRFEFYDGIIVNGVGYSGAISFEKFRNDFDAHFQYVHRQDTFQEGLTASARRLLKVELETFVQKLTHEDFTEALKNTLKIERKRIETHYRDDMQENYVINNEWKKLNA